MCSRSRENLAFWRWLIGYRRRSLPTVLAAIAGHATVHRLRTPCAVDRFLRHAATTAKRGLLLFTVMVV